jgi:hypothetical protein
MRDGGTGMRRSRHVILPCRRHPSYCRAGGAHRGRCVA